MKLVALWRVLRHYLNHPLGRRDRIGTLMRILRWQAGSRLLGAKAAMSFVDGTRLLVEAGMRGATGNVYVGLMEFEDMAFVLHLLREGDQFLDVGANAGVYSILAGVRGAEVLALEPVPATYEQLLDNVHLNRFETRIEARKLGVGKEPGELCFSTASGPTNHVLPDEEGDARSVTVPVDSLDNIRRGLGPCHDEDRCRGVRGQCHPRRAGASGPTIAASRIDRTQRPRRVMASAMPTSTPGCWTSVFVPCAMSPSCASWWRWMNTTPAAIRFMFGPSRRWSNGCGKRQRRGWSVFPFEQAALAMISVENTGNVQSLAGLSTFTRLANKRGEFQAGAYDDGR